MSHEIEQGLHERLCAYVLGEASPAERAEVERALEADAGLRAERARLEATIGIVRGALGDEEGLAPGAAEALLARSRAARTPWWARPSVRIAAGLVALASVAGALAYRQAAQRRAQAPIAECETLPAERSGEDELVVRLERKDEALAAREQAPPLATPALSVMAAKEAPRDERLNPIGYGDSGGDPTAHAERALQSLGYSEPATAPEVVDRYAFDTSAPAAPPASTAIGVGASGAEGTGRPSPFGARKLESGIGQGRAGDPTVAARRPASPASGLTSGGDDFFLGQGAARPAPAPSGPATAGPSGPAAPAPGGAGPSTGGPRGGPKPSTGGLGATAPAPVHLGGLGYVGDDGSAARVGRQLMDYGYAELDSADRRLRFATSEERDQWIDRECRRVLDGCFPRPHERPRDMFFRFWGDNAFEIAALDPQSTFSIDVDTASYTLARRYLEEGHLPEKAQVRTEEFVNYFPSDVPAPTEGTFAVHTDLAPSRFSADAGRSMLRVVLRGREVAKEQRKPLALTFVIDVSGSMAQQNRLEMVKHCLRLLVSQLDANDAIAIVVFSNDARVVLPSTSAAQRGVIEAALFPLRPESSTNSEAGLRLGYEVALASLNPNATNRVVFLSDGVANVGVTDADAITGEVSRIREKGILLNTIGVGMGNHNDVLLEQLADKGDGVCHYVDDAAEAKRVLVDGFLGTFETIARDVKVQVEFDPAQVLRYRLLGYENRAVADRDFRNDAVDAGEVGSGHQVTALYELELAGSAAEKPLATVRVRWKAPKRAGTAGVEVDAATEAAFPVLASRATGFEGAGAGYRRAVIVAQFAEILRRSQHARGESLDDLIAEAAKLERELQDPRFTELYALMQRSRALILASLPRCDEICQAVDLVRRNRILRAEHELLAQERDGKLLEDLERQNQELEQRIRDLLRRKLEAR